MLIRTQPNPSEVQSETASSVSNKSAPVSPEMAEQAVNERGFFLYEWISREELRMTLERDYLQIVRWASIPLAILCGIFAFIGFAGGPIGSVIAVAIVLGIFYSLVFFYLFLTFVYRSYLYTKGADVIITDNHYVAGGNIIPKQDSSRLGSVFRTYENQFDEKFLEDSKLAEKKSTAKQALFDNLKDIASGWGKLLQNVGRSRDSWGIILALIIAWVLYSGMMLAVYFVGIFFISIFGRLFSWIAHLFLRASNNLEYKVQDLFADIDMKSKRLSDSNDTIIHLLDEAKRNEWKDGLLTKLNDSIEVISSLSSDSVDATRKLRETLESSKYRDIFNFVKYGGWVKTQILEPIESILLLLEKNRDILKSTIVSLENQIIETSDSTLRGPLTLQKDRFEMQVESFERNIGLLESYQLKLK